MALFGFVAIVVAGAGERREQEHGPNDDQRNDDEHACHVLHLSCLPTGDGRDDYDLVPVAETSIETTNVVNVVAV